MNKEITKNRNCRFCKNSHFKKVFSFGPTPLANAFLKKSELNKKENFYPLDVYFCLSCHLLQLRDIVSPEILFKDYVYVSSTSSVFVRHFQDFARDITQRFRLNKESLVIDIGSNDGILLIPFKKFGTRVLGIEPAKNIAKIANKQGIKTLPHFFNTDLAKSVLKKYGSVSIITATNVFAHINDLDELVNGVKQLLHQEGVFIIEVPYLVDFLYKNLFDTVYHEHLSYIAISPLNIYFNRMGMKIFDVQRIDSHGGSIRVFIAKKESTFEITSSVSKLVISEKTLNLDHIKIYIEFAKKIEKNKIKLLKLLNQLKRQNKKIIGYGAPAKGNTLLNYFQIDHKILDYIADDSEYKQGLYTPGTHIPVLSPKKISQQEPDYILILAWNFAESIIKKYRQFYQRGGKFIIPVPEPYIN